MKKLVFLFLLSVLFLNLKAQPFINEIQQFRKQDSLEAPAKDQILFIGSSSFTMWKDVGKAFPDKKILNRAFGGSSLPHLIQYIEDIVYPYQPKQIVIYCGENDFASDSTLTPETVAGRFEELFFLIRKKYPKVPIAFVSMKPSPSREHLMPKFLHANFLIKSFLKKKKKTNYVDVYYPMLAEGRVRQDIFLSDRLHMNQKGYDIWIPEIRKVLK